MIVYYCIKYGSLLYRTKKPGISDLSKTPGVFPIHTRMGWQNQYKIFEMLTIFS